MTLNQIKQAIECGQKVFWKNSSYQVIKGNIGQHLIQHNNGHCIGLTWQNGKTMNGLPADFHIDKTQSKISK